MSAMIAAELQSWRFAAGKRSFAQRGDILAFNQAGEPALALVSLDGAYARGVGERGLCMLPVERAVTAWRV